MSLEQIIMSKMKDAMKAKDEGTLRGLRAIKAGIILAKTAEGAKGELGPEDEIKMLQKLMKQRKDSLQIYQEQNRADLAKKEEEEMSVIQQFLPVSLGAEELNKEIKIIIAETGASTLADMGKVMGIATKKLGGRADGKSISAAVKQLLAQ